MQLVFVENEFGPGPAGALSFNVMAAVAQYYSDNLRTEVLKGIDERVREGWAHGGAAYGYRNVSENREEPVQPHPEKSKTVVRIFELYATGSHTFESLADHLEREGHVYQPSHPRFHRTALSYILNNRTYLGEVKRRGNYSPGRHRPLVDVATFQTCQDVLHGKNHRRNGSPNLPLAGGLFQCDFCGALITGERIRRKLRSGGVRVHDYYRCANNAPGDDHPTVRWRTDDLEEAIIADLETLRLPASELAGWFRTSLQAAFSDITGMQQNQAKALHKRRAELKGMQDRLLNAFLAGTVDEETFHAKQAELRHETVQVDESLARLGDVSPTEVQAALAVFDFSQNAG